MRRVEDPTYPSGCCAMTRFMRRIKDPTYAWLALKTLMNGSGKALKIGRLNAQTWRVFLQPSLTQ